VSCIEAGDTYATPPVAGGGSVYAGGSDGALVAIDAITGQVRWLIPTTCPCTYYGTPTLSANGSDLYVASTTYVSGGGSINDLDELNASTGALIWSRDVDATCSTSFSWYDVGIADAGSLLYVNGCDLEALSASTGAVEWHSAGDLGPDVLPPVVAGNLVIASTGDQGLAAFNATTGKLLWRNTKVVVTSTASYSAAATIANGVVYVDEASSFVMLNSSTGAQLGMRQPPSGFQFDGDAIPVDGHIYIAAYGPTGDRLVAYEP
jgi:outer membrane protein assembly factor BamB